jgi:hypothetical protein
VEAKSAKHCFHALVVPRNHAQGTIKIVQCTPEVRLKIHRTWRVRLPNSVRLARADPLAHSD